MKKWIIAAAAIVALWLAVFSCSKKTEAPVVQAAVIEQVQPVAKPAAKTAVKHKDVHKAHRKAAAPEPVLFLGIPGLVLN